MDWLVIPRHSESCHARPANAASDQYSICGVLVCCVLKALCDCMLRPEMQHDMKANSKQTYSRLAC